MTNDVTWRWVREVSAADVTSLEKAKRRWNGMDSKYTSVGGKIPIELHALGLGFWRDAGKDSEIYVNL